MTTLYGREGVENSPPEPGIPNRFQPHGACTRCKKYLATEVWQPNGSNFEAVHGLFEFWCMRCVLEVQIAHAQTCADNLVKLRAALAEVRVTPIQ